MTRLDVADVDVRLGGVRVLEAVSVDVESGQFVGLVGPNGAGKSTLLRTINAILAPESGTVSLDGDAVHELSSREASRRVATVPQDTSLSFDFTVREVVAMGRTPYRSPFGRATGADAEHVTDALERTETLALADRPITDLSGGERQRVVLARSLAQDTPVLLLDEPTSSLDIHHQVRTLELVRDLVETESKTVVAAIHDLNLAAHYCDDLVLLSDGQVLSSGSPERVLTREHLEAAFGTRAVVSRHPVTGSVYVTALPDGAERTRDERVHVVGGGGTASRLLYLLSAAGFSVSVGAVNEGDSDLETARLLGLETVVEEPFAPVDPETRRAVADRVADADVTVVADLEVGAGNLPNLAAAAESDSLVVVEERPFADRNYAGAEARVLYGRLCERGRIVGPDDLLSTVEELLAGDARDTPAEDVRDQRDTPTYGSQPGH